jgi:hypothetical protein
MPVLLAPLNMDETGQIYGGGIGTMTGSGDPLTPGTDQSTCTNWTSTSNLGTAGEPPYSSYNFMARHGFSQCSVAQAVWCLQQ